MNRGNLTLEELNKIQATIENNLSIEASGEESIKGFFVFQVLRLASLYIILDDIYLFYVACFVLIISDFALFLILKANNRKIKKQTGVSSAKLASTDLYLLGHLIYVAGFFWYLTFRRSYRASDIWFREFIYNNIYDFQPMKEIFYQKISDHLDVSKLSSVLSSAKVEEIVVFLQFLPS